MKLNNIIVVICCMMIVSSCVNNDSRENLFLDPVETIIDISITDVCKVDTIYLYLDRTSFEGGVSITNDEKVCFFDYQLCFLFEFDRNGSYLGRKIGKGHSRAEIVIGSAYASSFLDDGGFCILGGNDGLYIYDSDFMADPDRTYNHVRKYSPSIELADRFDSYNINTLPLVCRSYGNSVYT